MVVDSAVPEKDVGDVAGDSAGRAVARAVAEPACGEMLRVRRPGDTKPPPGDGGLTNPRPTLPALPALAVRSSRSRGEGSGCDSRSAASPSVAPCDGASGREPGGRIAAGTEDERIDGTGAGDPKAPAESGAVEDEDGDGCDGGGGGGRDGGVRVAGRPRAAGDGGGGAHSTPAVGNASAASNGAFDSGEAGADPARGGGRPSRRSRSCRSRRRSVSAAISARRARAALVSWYARRCWRAGERVGEAPGEGDAARPASRSMAATARPSRVAGPKRIGALPRRAPVPSTMRRAFGANPAPSEGYAVDSGASQGGARPRAPGLGAHAPTRALLDSRAFARRSPPRGLRGAPRGPGPPAAPTHAFFVVVCIGCVAAYAAGGSYLPANTVIKEGWLEKADKHGSNWQRRCVCPAGEGIALVS